MNHAARDHGWVRKLQALVEATHAVESSHSAGQRCSLVAESASEYCSLCTGQAFMHVNVNDVHRERKQQLTNLSSEHCSAVDGVAVQVAGQLQCRVRGLVGSDRAKQLQWGVSTSAARPMNAQLTRPHSRLASSRESNKCSFTWAHLLQHAAQRC